MIATVKVLYLIANLHFFKLKICPRASLLCSFFIGCISIKHFGGVRKFSVHKLFALSDR